MNNKAWVCHELSDDLSGLRLSDWPLPDCGPQDVRLRVRAAALNFPDLLMAQGKYQHKPPLPFVAGMECAGEVQAVGAAVQGIRPGDRLCFNGRGGAFTEQLVAPAQLLRPLPAGMDFAEGAAYGVTAVTAWVALVRRGALQRGETLLVHGASGGTGLAAVQLGHYLGARVIATGSSAHKLQAARAAGAEQLLLLREGAAGLADEVKQLTGGRGADVVFDPVGGELFDASTHCTAWGGRLLVIGFASGRIGMLPSNLALIKGFAVIGVRAGEYGRRDPQRGEENRRAVEALAARGLFRPHIGARLPFAQAKDAYRAMAERRAAGKIVLEL
ncbi:MAG TPA: NADPH:quinone oxidoreductase family protein [Rubrivivax sp.]|nr:NADPH:quinone oxidoreductase family protein [Rubrivivax sp.]